MPEPIKIHPYDAYLLLSKLETVELIKTEAPSPEGQFTIDGILYQETTEIAPSAEALRAVGLA